MSVEVVTFLSRDFASNSYLITLGRLAVLVDAGARPSPVLRKLRELHTELRAIVLTHCHYDHVLHASHLKAATKAEIFAHFEDARALEEGDERTTAATLFSSKLPKLRVDHTLGDGDLLSFKDLTLWTVHTPGHTKGSVCYYLPEARAVFTGDLIFADGIGRVDLPGGSWEEMQKSLERFEAFVASKGVKIAYPGHGLPFEL